MSIIIQNRIIIRIYLNLELQNIYKLRSFEWWYEIKKMTFTCTWKEYMYHIFWKLLKINTHRKLHMIRTFFVCEHLSDTASIILFWIENVYISCGYGIIQRNICFYTSTKSWRCYIFTAVCLCVCLSVCPMFSCFLFVCVLFFVLF